MSQAQATTLSPEYDGQHSSHDMRAHKRLWAAVFYLGLQDAAVQFKVLLNPRNERPEAAFPALVWLNSDERNGPGSFVELCELFDLEPERARNAWRLQVRTLLAKARNAENYAKSLAKEAV